MRVAFAMRGFQQAWNVEVEHTPDDDDDDDGGRHEDDRREPAERGDASPAPA